MTESFGKLGQLRNWFAGMAVIFLPWMVVFLLRELGPITYQPLSGEFLWFLMICLSASFAMYSLGYFMSLSAQACPPLQGEALNAQCIFRGFFRFLYICTALFAVLSFYDYLVVKGANLSEIVANRELENVAGPRNSLIGACVALLSGAPPLLVALFLTRRDAFGYEKLYLYIVIFFGFAAMFLSGGRNPFFIGLLFILSFYYIFSPKRKPMRKTAGNQILIWGAAVAVVLGVAYSMYLFVARSIYVGVGLDSMIDTFSANYGLSIYPFLPKSELLSALYAIVVFLTFYVTHALNYISDYFAASYSPMLHGAYTVPHLARLLDVLAGTESFNQSRAALLVNGAYLSSPGSFYLDFGFLGAIVVSGVLSFVFGRYSARLSHLVLVQKMVFAYLTVMFVFSPIYCVFGMANGFSIIFLLAILLMLSIRLVGGKSSKSSIAPSAR